MARVLCIEDDPDIQHLIGQVLFREGYEITYAWNGREGYEKVLSSAPDVILLDLMLPLMNGVELLKKLREERATEKIPVVILSAYGDEANMLGHSLRALGAAAYLRKPIEIHELISVLRRVLAQSLAAETPAAPPRPEFLRKGAVAADPRLLTVWVNDRWIATLPDKSFALLRVLMEAAGPVPRPALLAALGYDAGKADALKQAVYRLRRSLGGERRRVRSVGDGYELQG